jgi:hypothetical protein
VTNICPNPTRWNAIYQRLLEMARQRKIVPAPPIPLILNGWASTNDVDKSERWAQTVRWAEQNGVIDLVSVEQQDWYAVENPSSYEIGPLGGPMHLPWRFDPAERPAGDAAQDALSRLTENWPGIAGEIAQFTRPVCLAGAKMRRLLVCVAPSAPNPPWGTWDKLAEDESRRRFSDLRRKVNAVIAPLEVDHIDFEVGH